MKRILFIIFLTLLFTAGCNDDDNDDTQPANEVQMSTSSFMPQTLTVPLGTTVRWVNSSSVNHTVTINDELFDEAVSPAEAFSYTFSTAGTYNYICTIHAGMSGTIVVQ